MRSLLCFSVIISDSAWVNSMRKVLKKRVGWQSDNKGFTMVEILVVLVILAILAAALIPAMTGFVEESRGKAFISEARTAYVAAQSKVTEKVSLQADYYSNATNGEAHKNAFKTAINNSSNPINSMMKDSYTTGAEITDIEISSSGKVESLVYKAGKYEVTIRPGAEAEVKKVN